MVLGCDRMEEISVWEQIWRTLVKWYTAYSQAIHVVFVRELGDFVEYLIDIIVFFLVVRMIAKSAFKADSKK